MEEIKREDSEQSLELIKNTIDGKDSFRPEDVPPAVLKRLPRYFRYLRELIRTGKTRISSSELANLMNVTASQIRQDFNWFGGFGQQGYGYNVNFLYTKICEILGVGCGFRVAIIGAGNLGKALVQSPMMDKRGVDVVALFDIDPAVVGTSVNDVHVYHMDDLEGIIDELCVDIVVLTLPKDRALEVSRRIEKTGIYGIWNFTGKELKLDRKNIAIENVHLGDSLMILCYEVAKNINGNGVKNADKNTESEK